MNDKGLLIISEEFRKGMIGNRSSEGFCYALSAPLTSYLEFLGFKCELIKGKIGGAEHYWIALPDGRILDPTADQFNDSISPIYWGLKPDNYKKEVHD